MSTAKRINILTDELAKAWKDRDTLRVLELQNELRKLQDTLNRQIDLNVARMYMAARNRTKVELN